MAFRIDFSPEADEHITALRAHERVYVGGKEIELLRR